MKEVRLFTKDGVRYKITLEAVELTDEKCEMMEFQSALIGVSMDYGKRLAEEEIYNKALDDFIKKAETERDEVLNWDEDEYENGMRAGYQYSIEIAENLKKLDELGE